VDDGRAFAEGLIKQLTGGDRLKARRMRQDFYEFEPVFKLFLLANHRPIVRGTDHAIWRRIKLLPFNQVITADEKDPCLREKLNAEAPGILNWMIEGCLAWQASGMGEPEAVSAATSAYRTDSDPLASFITEACVFGEEYKTQSSVLYNGYKDWAFNQGLSEKERLTSTRFGTLMAERFPRRSERSGNFFYGIGLASEHPARRRVEGLGRPSESEVEGCRQNPVNALVINDREEIRYNPPQPSTPSAGDKDSGPAGDDIEDLREIVLSMASELDWRDLQISKAETIRGETCSESQRAPRHGNGSPPTHRRHCFWRQSVAWKRLEHRHEIRNSGDPQLFRMPPSFRLRLSLL
jgi:hypothetical protein